MGEAMIVEMLLTVFVIAFLGACALGHVLLLAALFTEPRPPSPVSDHVLYGPGELTAIGCAETAA